MSVFRDRLAAAQALLLDGATGTELSRRGVDIGLPLWSARALLEAPDELLAVHRDHVAAGADIITANTFRTHERSLAAGGIEGRAAELTRRAVDIAREAAGARCLVAGSMAPLEDCYSPHLVPENAVLDDEHGAMAAALAAAGVDVLLVETMNTLREALAAAAAALATGLPTIVAVVCGRDGRLLSGENIDTAAPALARLQPDLLGINCAPAPYLAAPLAVMAAVVDSPLAAYGNVGYAADTGWVNTGSVEPAAYAREAATWLQSRARIIGGCCGTGPGHTAALRALIDS